MRSQRRDVSQLFFGPFRIIPLLLLCFSLSELQADDTGEKTSQGQVFESSRSVVRSSSRRRSRRHLPTVSDVILPSLTPSVKKRNSPPVVTSAITAAPRYGYGSNLDNPSPVSTIIQPQPIYIFSPRYNNTQYWPVNRYYGYGFGLGYGYGYGHYYSGGHHSYSHGGHHYSGGVH